MKIDKEVRNYLMSNPDFFKKNMDLLSKFFVFSDKEQANHGSIYKKHLELLRNQNSTFEEKNKDLLDLLQYNHQRLQGVQDFFHRVLHNKEKAPLHAFIDALQSIDIDSFHLLFLEDKVPDSLKNIKETFSFNSSSKNWLAIEAMDPWKRIKMDACTSCNFKDFSLDFSKKAKSYALIGLKIFEWDTRFCILFGHADVDKFSANMNPILLEYIGVMLQLILQNYLLHHEHRSNG